MNQKIKLSEADKYHLQALAAQQEIQRMRVQAFLTTLFTSYGVSPEENQIDVDSGVFVRTPKPNGDDPLPLSVDPAAVDSAPPARTPLKSVKAGKSNVAS